jgi:predicted ArsR family transcriptional regulator
VTNEIEKTKIGSRFFNSTRGQIVRLIRGSERTVEELAASLDLTDNAVRSHLATLERDGLVTQSGIRKGPRKPHYTYVLTPAAEDLFPKSYDTLLNILLRVLKEKIPYQELRAVLRDVGRTLAKNKMTKRSNASDLPARIREAVALLQDLGGTPQLKTEGNKLIIRSGSCPLATAVENHSEVCSVAEAFIAEVTGARVREKCNKTETPPRCCFEITSTSKAKSKS